MRIVRSLYGKLSDFRSPTPKIQYGKALKDIRALQASISRFGLLSPLIVSKNKNRYIVIDGRKRLAALRRLQFEGNLPRSLVQVPYVLIDTSRKSSPDLSLLTNVEKYESVKTLQDKGQTLSEIAAHLHITKDKVRDLLKVDSLSGRLKAAFFGDALSLSQVKAFATIPNYAAQDDLLIKLGPFVKENDILKAITDGCAVLTLSEDNVIILPSRTLPEVALSEAA